MIKKVFGRSYWRSARKAFSTVNDEEVRKFSKVKDWWDPHGSQRGLHSYNPLRVDFVKKNVYSYGSPSEGFNFLKGKQILDVGSGPGIFAEVGSKFT